MKKYPVWLLGSVTVAISLVTLPGSGGQDRASLAACQASRSTAGLKSSLWT